MSNALDRSIKMASKDSFLFSKVYAASTNFKTVSAELDFGLNPNWCMLKELKKNNTLKYINVWKTLYNYYLKQPLQFINSKYIRNLPMNQ